MFFNQRDFNIFFKVIKISSKVQRRNSSTQEMYKRSTYLEKEKRSRKAWKLSTLGKSKAATQR